MVKLVTNGLYIQASFGNDIGVPDSLYDNRAAINYPISLIYKRKRVLEQRITPHVSHRHGQQT